MENTKKIQVDFLNGKILPSLIRFAIPALLSLLFQQLYNTVDTIIIGRTLGESALAAMGSASAVYDLFLGFTNGIGSGLAIVTARSFGSGDHYLLKKTTAAAVVISAVTSVIMTTVASLSLHPFLTVLNTPAEVIDQSYAYVSTIVMFFAVTLAYNLCSGMMRAIGNSVIPLIFLVVASVCNIGLDLLLIIVFKMGVRGAAVATVISQLISVVLCVIYMLKKEPLLIPKKEHFRIDAELYREMIAQGISMGLMSCIVNSGTAILQSAINGLGYLVVAGHVAARKVFFFMMTLNISFMQATNMFVSQNYGAGNRERIRRGIIISYVYSVVLYLFLGIVMIFAAPFLIGFVSGSSESVILENGALYLKVAVPCMSILGILNTTRSALQSIGRKILPIISSVMELIGKILFVMLLIPHFGYNAVIACEPVIWVFMDIELLLSFWMSPYMRGKSDK